jgi:ferric-dicitrate binding protein FerR (iron transport regulator)
MVLMAEPAKSPAPIDEADFARRRRQRSIALALALGAFVIIVFVLTIVKMGPAVLDRPL